MLTGNILLVIIATLLAILIAGGVFAIYKILPTTSIAKLDKESLIIEVDEVNPNMTQGYGFIVDGKVVLSYDNKPLLFKNRAIAKECLRDKFSGAGEIIYQKWDVEKQQLILGRVQQRGAN